VAYNGNCIVCSNPDSRILFDFDDSMKVMECRNCGLVYVNPINSQEAANLYNEEYFQGYVENYKDYRVKQFSRGIETIHNYIPPGKVLDIGCALGFFLDLANEKGWYTYGVEISEYAARHISSRHNVFVGELAEAKFPDKFFDLITLWDTIEHVANPPELLLEAHRILKEDGLLFVNLPNKDDLFLKIKSTLYRMMGAKVVNLKRHFIHHIYYFSPATIEKLLNKCGFCIIKMDLNVDDLALTGANKNGCLTIAKTTLKSVCYLTEKMWKRKRNEILVYARHY